MQLLGRAFLVNIILINMIVCSDMPQEDTHAMQCSTHAGRILSIASDALSNELIITTRPGVRFVRNMQCTRYGDVGSCKDVFHIAPGDVCATDESGALDVAVGRMRSDTARAVSCMYVNPMRAVSLIKLEGEPEVCIGRPSESSAALALRWPGEAWELAWWPIRGGKIKNLRSVSGAFTSLEGLVCTPDGEHVCIVQRDREQIIVVAIALATGKCIEIARRLVWGRLEISSLISIFPAFLTRGPVLHFVADNQSYLNLRCKNRHFFFAA
jgi:hypothetical protein